MLLLTGCIEEFDPPSEGFENLLVVEAFLTNESEPFEVKLSRTMPLDTIIWIPETGAQVSISNGSGEEYGLEEVNEGIYRFLGNLNARIGESYQLHLKTSNGYSYVSDPVTMCDTPPIDSVTWKYEKMPTGDVMGVQIYVNTHDPGNNTWYYRWQWKETWIFYTPSPAVIYWEDGLIKPMTEKTNACWKTGRSTDILIGTSKNLNQDIIYDFPLYSADNTTDRFNNRYSTNVKQYAMSEESYHYWQELKKVTENLGTLFDPQPSSIYGNIHNVNNENEIVLGYFDASAVREKRIFISSFDLPSTMRGPDDFSSCEEELVGYYNINEMVLDGWLLVNKEIIMGSVLYRMAPAFCVDCRYFGSNEKPDYW
jgi:hypothetical protein